MPKISIILCTVFLATACAARKHNNIVQIVYSAEMAAELYDRPYPVPSTVIEAFSPEHAYEAQRYFVTFLKRNDSVAGFKAGLTAKPAWEKFELQEPLAGVLLHQGRQATGSTLSRADYRNLRVETEIAFIVGQDIADPVDSVSQLKPLIKAVAPAIELPDLGFTDMSRLRGVDVIAANASAASFIIGPLVPPDAMNVNTLTLTLKRDGKIISTGAGRDAMGNQWQAALWLVNKMVGQGWVLHKNNVLLTGAIGSMQPGLAGVYSADFQDLGQISFTVVE